MTNTNWSDTDLDAAAGRIEHSLSRKLRGQQRLHRGGIAAGVVVLGVTSVAAASTLLPPQTKGEVNGAAPYISAVSSCLKTAGWNVWLAPSDGLDHAADSIHFSVNGYEQLRFADDIDRCRADVARANSVDVMDVIGLR
ncbi:hypothetical protein ITJ55_00610 [Frigoribacterium sp. VKM Ac-1396]|uniref:hypothetical protein n=1 Tax=Frigoribacterium sp. VKM Ac-1396 TaxID=2783821 RepID=UPI00188A1403|nr:hypothetical protein [Frigoribacterium sp. VKM Ac-1396]MBF4599304.1 hypothetical protein [Frigoribacterium sp. VKM Ac-1396]